MIQHQILDTKMFPSISEANDINEAVAISKHFIYENSSDTEDDEIVDNNEGTVETTADYNKFDVLLGRGRAYQLYPGNRRFHGT